MALRQGPPGRRSRSRLPAHVRVCRALLVVVDLHALVPASPLASTLPCWTGNRSLHYRARSGLVVRLLGAGHLRAGELWPCRRRHCVDYVPRWLRCLSSCGRRFRSDVERIAGRTRLPRQPTRPRLTTPHSPSGGQSPASVVAKRSGSPARVFGNVPRHILGGALGFAAEDREL